MPSRRRGLQGQQGLLHLRGKAKRIARSRQTIHPWRQTNPRIHEPKLLNLKNRPAAWSASQKQKHALATQPVQARCTRERGHIPTRRGGSHDASIGRTVINGQRRQPPKAPAGRRRRRRPVGVPGSERRPLAIAKAHGRAQGPGPAARAGIDKAHGAPAPRLALYALQR